MRARKLFLTGSFTALVALFSAFSNAATSQASLAIRGEILPASCDLFIDNGGELKLGKPNSSATPTNQNSVLLPERTIGINIQCPALTSFGIRAVDIASNAGSVKHDGFDANTIFSLGLTNRGESIGGYLAAIDKSRSWVDGNPLDSIIVSQDHGNSWQLMQGNLAANGKNVYSWGDKSQPRSARFVKLGLTVSPFLFKTSYSESVKIDGLTSFELVYL